MNAHKSSLLALVVAALLTPAIAMADTPWVPANTEQGFRYQPEHAGSTASRDQVRSDAKGASLNALVREGVPLDTFPAGTQVKTREQVRSEVLNLSAAEKQRMQELFRGN